MSDDGKVYLIGSGPGDPELITLKALRIARACDVVLYDNLIADEILVSLPRHIEKHYVGKRGGKPCPSQDEINNMLVSFAKQGKNVARLKGSDPLIFGRGGEEAKFLKEHGILFEIVPGVTSGIAAATYAGIPCTDRNKASFLMFITGHKAREKKHSTVPWEWVAKANGGTLVIYMGVGEIASIVSKLIDGGMSPSTPAAVIERGTFPTQRCFTSTLTDLPNAVQENSVKAPAVFVIGEVVDLKPYLDWMEKKPLTGVRIMVTRAVEQSEDTYRSLRNLGAEVLAYPTIMATGYIDDAGWDSFKEVQKTGGWLVFTSENGVRNFMSQLLDRDYDLRALSGFRIAAVGKGTAVALYDFHLKADFLPSCATAVDFASEFVSKHDLKGSTVIRVRGSLAGSVLENAAREAGAGVISLTAYKTETAIWPEGLKEKLFEYAPDAMLFTSGSTFRGFLQNLTEDEGRDLLSSSAVFSIGPSTSQVISSMGYDVTVESHEHTISGLTDALIKHFTNSR